MTESTGLIPPLWVIGLSVVLSLPAVLLALRARDRPERLRGATVYGVATLTIVVGLAMVIYAEAAGAPTLVGGGIVGLAGVGALTAVVAWLPEPDDAASGH